MLRRRHWELVVGVVVVVMVAVGVIEGVRGGCVEESGRKRRGNLMKRIGERRGSENQRSRVFDQAITSG